MEIIVLGAAVTMMLGVHALDGIRMFVSRKVERVIVWSYVVCTISLFVLFLY